MANSACVRLKCPNVYATNISFGCTKDTQGRRSLSLTQNRAVRVRRRVGWPSESAAAAACRAWRYEIGRV